MIKALNLVLIFLPLLACNPAKKLTDSDSISLYSIQEEVDKARVEISLFLEKNRINVSGSTMILIAYGMLTPDYHRDPCGFFHNEYGYENIDSTVLLSHGLISALIIDQNGGYIAKSSSYTFIEHPENLAAYNKEKTIIDIGIKEKYIVFIEIFNCHEDYIIGYKKGKVDVYRIDNGKMIFIYSK